MFASTMARETSKRSLDDDDLSAIDVLYGGVTLTSTTAQQVIGSSASGAGGGGGGCSLSGPDGEPSGPADLGFLVVLLVIIALRQRPSSRDR
jgi:MYXO-CTERM domain-containing protein